MHDSPSHPFIGLTEIVCNLKEREGERMREHGKKKERERGEDEEMKSENKRSVCSP